MLIDSFIGNVYLAVGNAKLSLNRFPGKFLIGLFIIKETFSNRFFIDHFHSFSR